MNDYAREVLIRAGLSGHPQIRGQLHTADGDCALGVLHIALHDDVREEAVACGITTICSLNWYKTMRVVFDISPMEVLRISELNDTCGLDFVGIVRKLEMD